MSKSKHLPGPWRLGDVVKLDGRTGDYQRIVDGEGMASNILAHVCVAHPANVELAEHGKANAHLIAAAPALYEALRYLLATRNAFDGMPELVESGVFADSEARAAAIKEATAALALANGASQ